MPKTEPIRPSVSSAAEAFAARLDQPSANAVIAVEPKKEKRDKFGRFSKIGGRTRKLQRPKVGIRGPSYYARQTQPALVRRCVILEHKVGRLDAETALREWADPVVVDPANLRQIRQKQVASTDHRVAVLHQVLHDMHEDRVPLTLPKRHEEIARRMAVRLGTKFAWRNLYRRPYRTMWQSFEADLEKHAADRAYWSSDRQRWTKSKLMWRIQLLSRKLSELKAAQRIRLLDQSLAEDGWEPIAEH